MTVYKNIFEYFIKLENTKCKNQPLNIHHRPVHNGEILKYPNKGKWNNEKEYFEENNIYYYSLNSKSLNKNEIDQLNNKALTNEIHQFMRLFFEILDTAKSKIPFSELQNYLESDLNKEIETSNKLFIDLFEERLSKYLINGQFNLKRILRRSREQIPISRIGEMDGYCIEQMQRQPGNTIAEKAGSKQTLFGIKRVESYDIAENRFIKHFFKQIEKEYLINKNEEPLANRKSFYNNIKLKNLESEMFKDVKNTNKITLNFVLLQNPIYNRFYRVYLKYSKISRMLLNDWGDRVNFIREITLLLIIQFLIDEKGSFYVNMDKFDIHNVMDNEKKNIEIPDNLIIGNFKDDRILTHYEIKRDTTNVEKGEIKIVRKIFNFMNNTESEKIFYFWFLWDRPDDALLLSISNLEKYHQKNGGYSIISYLTKNNMKNNENKHLNHIKLLSLDIIENNTLVNYINELQSILFEEGIVDNE